MRLLGVVGMVAAVGLMGGCASTRMMQRDGCWVKQTEKWPKRITEELGPCARTQIEWADDRLTRLVQECVAQADHRWQTRALQAWAKGETLPQQESEQQLLDQCMTQASSSLLPEHEALQARVKELDAERSELRETLAEDKRNSREDHIKVIDALAEAAKKPAPAAVATATSNGTATTENRSDTSTSPSNATWMPMPQAAMGPNGVPVACAQPAPLDEAAAKRQTATGGAGDAGTGEPTHSAAKAKPAPKKRTGTGSSTGTGTGAVAKKDLPACDPDKTPESPELARKDGAATAPAPAPAAPVTP